MTTLAITGAGLVLPDAGTGVRYVTQLTRPDRFTARQLRRTPRLALLALPAVEAAWQQAGLTNSADVGLVVGTGLADVHETAEFLRSLHERGPKLARPQHFQRSVHGALAGELAILYGLRGYNLTVSDGIYTGEAALFAGALAVRSGRCQSCVVVCADALSNATLLAHQELAGQVAVAEAAGALVVEDPAGAFERDADILAPLHRVDLTALRAAPPSPLEGVGYCGAQGLIRVIRAVQPGL